MIPLCGSLRPREPAGKHAPSRFRLAVEPVRDPSRQVFSKCIQNLPGIARTDRARFEPAIGVQGTRPRSFVKDNPGQISAFDNRTVIRNAKGRASHDKGLHAARRRHRHPASGHAVGLRRAVPGLDRSRSGPGRCRHRQTRGPGTLAAREPGCDAQLSADAAIGRSPPKAPAAGHTSSAPSMRSTELARPIAPAILRVVTPNSKRPGACSGRPEPASRRSVSWVGSFGGSSVEMNGIRSGIGESDELAEGPGGRGKPGLCSSTQGRRPWCEPRHRAS